MKPRTMNPLKFLASNRHTNKFDDDTCSTASSTDGSSQFNRRVPLFSVGFDESKNKVYECPEDMNNEEIVKDLWFSPEEQEKMKEANNCAVKISRASESYVAALASAYECCCKDPSDISIEHEQALHEQLKLYPARAGLEQKSLPAICKDRVARRQALSELAYNLKARNPDLSPKKLDLLMRRECSKITAPAKLFALYVAKAQRPQQDTS